MSHLRTIQSLERPITEKNFFLWSKDNMYRTSYGSQYSNKPLEPKNSILPGYAGFIPGIISNNGYGKSYARLAKENLSKDSLDVNPFKLSSTGFNYSRHDFIDHTKTAWTHRYGGKTMLKNHPCQNANNNLVTQEKDTYRDPRFQIPPTFRETCKFLENPRENTKQSGFLANYKISDGKGCVPDKILNGSRTRTEYRDRYNTILNFSNSKTKFHIRKLKSSQKAYADEIKY